MKRIAAFFLALALSCGGCDDPAPEDTEPVTPLEVCGTDVDEDGDGRVSCADDDCRLFAACVFAPADPVDVASAVPVTGIMGFHERVRFLFEGPDAIQRGVDEGAIEERNVTVVSGRAREPGGALIDAAAVTVVGRANLGRTYTRDNGAFDIALNGGADVVVRVEKPGYVPVMRTVHAAPEHATVLDDVVLTPIAAGTAVTFGRASFVMSDAASDANGSRRVGLYVPANVGAELLLPNGAKQALKVAILSLTEVTVGDDGPLAMPGRLPGASQYTFAAEFSVAEAEAVGAEHVLFDAPVYAYVDNFLGFEPGSLVPSGWFDRRNPSWRGDEDGIVLRVEEVVGGLAVLAAGEPLSAAELGELGITATERRELGSHYRAGEEVWRVPLKHFSAVDFNWAALRLFGIKGPLDFWGANRAKCSTHKETGSIINCDSQTLGEVMRLGGTPLTLVYQSGRVPGYLPTIYVPLHEGVLNPDIARVRVTMEVAGVHFEQVYDVDDGDEVPAIQEWTWDRLDAYGRFIQGAVPAEVEVAYDYPTSFGTEPAVIVSTTTALHPAGDDPDVGSFAQFSTADGTSVDVRRGLTRVSRRDILPIGGWDVSGEALGGWTLNVHHRFDPNVPALHFGSGTDLVARPDDRVLELVGGAWADQGLELAADGTPAKDAFLGLSFDVAVGRDGTVYSISGVTSHGSVRAIDPDGTVRTVAGAIAPETPNSPDDSGDGLPGPEARFGEVKVLDIGPDGRLYFLTHTGIWRVEEDGTVQRVVGGGDIEFASAPRGTHASHLRFSASVLTFDVARDGSIYIPTGFGQIWKVSPGGHGSVIAGVRTNSQCDNACGDGELATTVDFAVIKHLRVASDDTIIFAETIAPTDATTGHDVVRRIRTDGVVESVGDFEIEDIVDLELHPFTDDVYIAPSSDDWRGVAVLRVQDGQLVAFAGSPVAADQGPGSAEVSVADNTPASSQLFGQGAFAITPRGEVVFSNWYQLVKMRELLPTWTGKPYQIPSPGGDEVYEFFADGRHDKTRDAWTGAVIWTFEYDEASRLTAVIDAEGDRTQVRRNGASGLEAIVGPDGVTWAIGLGSDGFIDSITSPMGDVWTYGYAPGGLLTAMTSPTAHQWTFAYDEIGRLTRDQEATLDRVVEGTERSVTYSSAEGRQTDYREALVGASVSSETTGNARARTERMPDGFVERRLPDGTTVRQKSAPHPALGYIARYSEFVGIYTPGGATYEATATQTATLVGDELFGLAQWEEVVQTALSTQTSRWDGPSRTFTTMTGGGRGASAVVDELGRVVELERAGEATVSVMYDASGRPTRFRQAERELSMSYDGNGFLAEIATPDGSVQVSRDAAGRVTRGTRPDASTVAVAWDGMDNVASLAPPQRDAYTMSYNERGQPLSFDGPSSSYAFGYNGDFQLDRVTDPAGRATTFVYDANGRIASVGTPAETLTLAYDDGVPGMLDSTDQLLAARSDSGVDLDFAYDGGLVTGVAWTGAVSGDVSWRYGEDFRLEAIGVNGVDVRYAYDEDGAVTAAGDESIQYEPGTFRIATRQLGSVDFGYAYDEYGQLTSLTSPPLDLDYAYDDLGRVIQIVETDQGTARTLDYTYDLLGQLVEVRVDGAVTEAYTYDANGNRLSGPGVTEATHNAEDELLTYGSRTFTYSAGQLTSVTDGALTITYDYGTHGQLRAVDDGTTIVSYEHDAFHRRVGKRVDGTLVQGFLYQDQLNPIAELAADGTVRSRFVYASRAHVPDFMIQGGTTYAFVTDHLGSVRYVVDASDGSIAQRLEYDAFGQVLSDSNPGFQPFGFAGGLYDPDTGLVRFGVRDYDPSVGRWTARDPIAFAGGQTNFFVYASNSPQALIDPSGNIPHLVLLVPGGFGAFFNAYEARGQSHADVARAAFSGGLGGLLAGAGAVAAGPLAPLGAIAGTAVGAGLTKAIDLTYCVDALNTSFGEDVVTSGFAAGFAAAAGVAVATVAGVFIGGVAIGGSSVATAQQLARPSLTRTLAGVEPQVWDAGIAAVSSGATAGTLEGIIGDLGAW